MRTIDFLVLCCDEEQYVSIQSGDDCEELTDFWISEVKANYPESMGENKQKWLESEMLGWLVEYSTLVIFI